MKGNDPLPPLSWDSRRIQLQGFMTGLHQLEWLLVTLIVLYLAIIGAPDENSHWLLVTTVLYFGFSLIASRLQFFGNRHRWLLALHTWVMIGFITWFLHSTQGVSGPLTSLYLLAVVTSALTLGVLATMLEVMVIGACVLLLFELGDQSLMAPSNLSLVSINLIAFLIVGYLTSALVDGIQVSNRMLLEMASRDPLTGLFNRRAFNDLVQPIHAMAKRSRRPYSIVVIDMDGLKDINDTQGHGAGDHIITALAQQLTDHTRSSDLLARYGGDEFVIMLPDTDARGAVRMLHRLITDPDEQASPISIGVASYPEHGDSFESLFAHADQAMYASKASGGNRIHVHGTPQAA
ncbi:GGDEF domain-containing protein [Halomonas sp. M4R1S46]|uniref:GGDEF domain-containing protein n=1 Tax=Halomonas sp. M4R1S46 TaxID=2982692 RepID=UPI0021E5010F|nr:GGDEF domain-containing protein [Halomonas sp. M4R1S46]UYG07376.1 GGDEF domain-containing protein [Halomonas sp. M4R1S46]